MAATIRPLLLGVFVIGLAAGAAAQSVRDPIPVDPAVGTSSSGGDADDPAIWIHPTDPGRSVVIGSDKSNGIHVWDLAGRELQALPQGTAVNNVDVRRDVLWGAGRADIVVANLRNAGKLAVFRVNPDWRGSDVLVQLAGASSTTNRIQSDSYGLGLYRRPSDAALFVFDRPKDGGVLRQYRVEADGTGAKLSAVRDLAYTGGTAEGLVADDELGFLYVSEESRAIHKYLADPAASTSSLATFATADGIVPDREGVALYLLPGGQGYLLLSSQGNHTVKVYDRAGNNAYVTTIAKTGSKDTDGIDVTSLATPQFPKGFLVAHDSDSSSFKLYDWAHLAAAGLRASTGSPPPEPDPGPEPEPEPDPPPDGALSTPAKPRLSVPVLPARQAVPAP